MFPSKMGSEASENRSKEMENLSLQTGSSPRNLLQRFMSRETLDSTRSEGEDDEDEEEVELNLGLSLGGRFGVDKHASKLKRSSSIAGSIPIFREDDGANAPPPSVPHPTTLIRASSLPTVTEEEWRKRKELQTLRRMAAKRRRSEKQRISRGKMEESKGLQGARNSCEARSSSSASSLQEQGDSEAATGSSGTKTSGSERTPGWVGETVENKEKGGGKAMEDMPHVFTKGEGPNGKRVDGILYKYGKGEEVRIMCVCHGNFFSPAEFVKHAGGGDVDNPLRHIVINPSSSSLL